MGTYYKQVAAYKTAKGLIEFVDDTRYEQEVMACRICTTPGSVST